MRQNSPRRSTYMKSVHGWSKERCNWAEMQAGQLRILHPSRLVYMMNIGLQRGVRHEQNRNYNDSSYSLIVGDQTTFRGLLTRRSVCWFRGTTENPVSRNVHVRDKSGSEFECLRVMKNRKIQRASTNDELMIRGLQIFV